MTTNYTPNGGSLAVSEGTSSVNIALLGSYLAGSFMRLDPVRQGLRPGRLGVGVVGRAQHRDEDLGIAYLTGRGIDNADLLARVVDEHLVAGHVMLAHHRRQPPLELPIKIAEARVAVAVQMSLAVLLPQHHQADARALELAGKSRPIGLGPPTKPRLHPASGEQPLFQLRVRQFGSQRPGKSCRRRPQEIVLDRAARLPSMRPIARAPKPSWCSRSICRNCRMVSSLLVGIPPSPAMIEEGSMPESLTRKKTAPGVRLQIGMVAVFKPEPCPASRRNPRPE
jgi:hypothetical protein